MQQNKIEELKQYGFVFNGYQGFIDKANLAQMAMDASLLTPPNSGIPVEYTAFLDPAIIRILNAPRRARKIVGERKIGDWTTPYVRFTQIEQTGFVQPYDDYADNGKSDINPTFPTRDNYVFETTIEYGDRETDIASRAKFNLVSEKQVSAATTIDLAMNRFYFYGVAGLQNFGLLNDPNLPNALTPVNGASGQKTWPTKTAVERYNDILALVADLADRSKGYIDENSRLKLVISPARSPLLLGTSDLMANSVKALLKEGLPNLDVVIAPEMSTDAGEMMMLFADVVDADDTANKVADLVFSEKMRAGRVVPYLSHFKQKYSAGTFGAVIFQPFAVASMLGI